jgi:hypothetical protein
MKHAVNHSYKFDNYGLVSALCLSHGLVSYACEILNFIVLCNVTTVMDCINSFVAFYIIADLDTIYYKVMMTTTELEQLNEDFVKILTVRHCTTSQDARLRIKENKLTPEKLGVPRNSFGTANKTVPEYIGIRFRDRPWHNKLCFMVYKTIKFLHISYWYYFAPFYFFFLFFVL